MGSLLSAACYASFNGANDICKQVRALGTSDATRAFKPDSAQLAALPQLPQLNPDIPVYTLAAQIEIYTSFFGNNDTDLGDGGDVIVLEDSAQAIARKVDGIGGAQTINCGKIDITDFFRSAHSCWHSTETNDLRFLEAAAHQITLVETKFNAPALTSPTSVAVTYDAEFWVADGANRVAACQISSNVAECLDYAGYIKPPSGVCPTRSPDVVGAAISGPHSGWWCQGGIAEGALILGVVSTPSTAWHTGRDWPTLTGTVGEDAGDKAVLPSGASISRGSITCSVAGTSVRCRNSSNGVWFFLAPSGLTTDGKVTVGQVTYSH